MAVINVERKWTKVAKTSKTRIELRTSLDLTFYCKMIVDRYILENKLYNFNY